MISKDDDFTLQQKIENLTNILDHWVPVLEQMELIKNNLKQLPNELEKIQQNIHVENRQQARRSNQKVLSLIAISQEINNQKILNSRLQSILASLEAETPRLILLGENISDLVCLREIIEALQERLEIKTTDDYEAEFYSFPEKKEQEPKQNKILGYLGHSWHNIINQTKSNRKIKFALVFGLLLGWNLLGTFIYKQAVDRNDEHQVINMENSQENPESDRLSNTIEKQ